MNIAVNILFQAAAFIAQGANLFAGFVPQKYQPFVAFVIVVAQAAVALRAHLSNPDGTPAEEPYQGGK